MEPLPSAEEALSVPDLQGPKVSPTLWYRIHVFIYDLRHFREKVASEARLGQVIDRFYLGPPYFKADEVESLKSLVIQEGKTLVQLTEESLAERLNRRAKKRVDSGDFREGLWN